MTVTEALLRGAEVLFARPALQAYARRDAELLLMHVLSCERSAIIAHPERILTADEQSAYHAVLALRLDSTPVQYITGVQEFYGSPIAVTPDVLIPRPETEHLVEAVLALVPSGTPARILDIGTGSGAIAVVLARSLPLADLTAIDISPHALAVARGNAILHHVESRIKFLLSDLFSAIPATTPPFDCIVSNPPYIAEGDRETLSAEVLDHEPSQALFSGPTGYEAYERILPAAPAYLRSSGSLLLEIGYGQQPRIAQLLTGAGYMDIEFIPDLQAIPRVAVARKP